MCHHHETREWTALREELEEAEPDETDEEPTAAEVEAEPEVDDRLPPIQPSD